MIVNGDNLINLTGETLFFVNEEREVILTIPPAFEEVETNYNIRRDSIESMNVRKRNKVGDIPLFMVDSIIIPQLSPTKHNEFYIVTEEVAFKIHQVDFRIDVLFPTDIQRIFWDEFGIKTVHYKSLSFIHLNCTLYQK